MVLGNEEQCEGQPVDCDVTLRIARDQCYLKCCRLKPLSALQLLVQIQCLTLTNGNSHILVGLRDGKLIIVGVKGKQDGR